MSVNQSEPTTPSNPLLEPTTTSVAIRIRNLVVVFVAIVLSVTIFLGLRTGTSTASLAAMAETATPLNVALSNHKPTLMEFYADWCTACQAMAQDMSDLRQEYGDRVNFVMLNVDNSKWLPEMLAYRVDGIPHFVFLGTEGETIASTIGEQPRTIMASNLEALIAGQALPYVRSQGRTSELDSAAIPQPRPDDPRSHGSQVLID
ncbi:thioredoxin family protein [Thermocoleostomius sinensis]|uniref:Thioredoxin family protein n=1 Tax=Thermocoleostomius sinensis A174 TaxID=2016057 RepID=A0A9E8ZCS5_9CYAN|nr:thioredoxin family protein [Thermocoleostomius sinensis]WAL60879.1 thioredoxin family protein [Thermocoleostomius sinensis A174]